MSPLTTGDNPGKRNSLRGPVQLAGQQSSGKQDTERISAHHILEVSGKNRFGNAVIIRPVMFRTEKNAQSMCYPIPSFHVGRNK